MGKARVTENKGAGLYKATRIVSDVDGNDTDADTFEAWCADYTADIDVGAIVGTVDVGGTGREYRDGLQTEIYILKPGFEDEELEMEGPAWDADDGQMKDASTMTPSRFFWNAAMRQGWQRWMPTYRTGKILDIDYNADTADVCMRPALDAIKGMLLEPDDLPECELNEELPDADFHIQQAQYFCERHPTHPMCQEFGARTQVSYDSWWATIVSVNTQVNTNVTYVRDGENDVWNIATGGTGDCEDYALGKMHLLAAAGVPASAMGLAIGKIGSGPARGTRDVDHAWAVVFTDQGLFHLDQAPNVPLGTQPGSNFQILRYNIYEILARKLTEVPIEYMNCNAQPFMEGDDVVVRFDDQDWSKPKIIGFVEEPRQCLGWYAIALIGNENHYKMFNLSTGLEYTLKWNTKEERIAIPSDNENDIVVYSGIQDSYFVDNIWSLIENIPAGAYIETSATITEIEYNVGEIPLPGFGTSCRDMRVVDEHRVKATTNGVDLIDEVATFTRNTSCSMADESSTCTWVNESGNTVTIYCDIGSYDTSTSMVFSGEFGSVSASYVSGGGTVISPFRNGPCCPDISEYYSSGNRILRSYTSYRIYDTTGAFGGVCRIRASYRIDSLKPDWPEWSSDSWINGSWQSKDFFMSAFQGFPGKREDIEGFSDPATWSFSKASNMNAFLESFEEHSDLIPVARVKCGIVPVLPEE